MAIVLPFGFDVVETDFFREISCLPSSTSDLLQALLSLRLTAEELYQTLVRSLRCRLDADGNGQAFAAQRTRIDPVIRGRLLQVIDSGVLAIRTGSRSRYRLLASYASSSVRKQLSRATCERPGGRLAAIMPGPAGGPIQPKQSSRTGESRRLRSAGPWSVSLAPLNLFGSACASAAAGQKT